MSRLRPSRGTMARTATQPVVLHRRDRRRLEPGSQLAGPVDEVLGAVVVEHDVGAGRDDAGDASLEHLDGLGLAGAVAADEDGLGPEDRLAEDLEALLAQGRAGLDDVGDAVGHPQRDGGLDGAVQPHDLGGQPARGQVGSDETGVRRRDALARDVLDRGHLTGLAGIPERRGAEAERHDLDGVGAGVEQQVAAGDPGVDGARADVDGDVARAQVEELDVVLGVGDDELLAVPTRAVARLAEQLDGRVGQGTLVGHGDSQHGEESPQRWE